MTGEVTSKPTPAGEPNTKRWPFGSPTFQKRASVMPVCSIEGSSAPLRFGGSFAHRHVQAPKVAQLEEPRL